MVFHDSIQTICSARCVGTIDLVRKQPELLRNPCTIQGVNSLSTLSLYLYDAILGQNIQVTRRHRRINTATLTEAHSVLWFHTMAKLVHQREAIEFAQRTQQFRQRLLIFNKGFGLKHS